MDIKIGLIGAGWMGRAHTNAFVNALLSFGSKAGKPVFEVISDVDEEVAKKACEELGFSRWTANWMEVIEDDSIDIIDIATPNVFHYEVAKAALNNGKNVYCEKPLTLTAEQSKELAELAKEKGVVNYVGYNNIMNPATSYVKELIESGKLGEIVGFSGVYTQDSLLDPSLPITWRHINKLSGSGALGDLGSHLLSISQYLLGDIDCVSAMAKTVIKDRPSEAGSSNLSKVENEDIISILASYENGAIGTFNFSRVAAGRKNNLTYEIQGTEGTVYYSLERMNEVNVYFTSDERADRGFRTVFLGPDHKGYSAFYPAAGIGIGYNDMKIIEVHELLSAVSNGTSYVCDFEFGAKIDGIVDAILESTEILNWVKVNKAKSIV